jgi:hypothetical protein
MLHRWPKSLHSQLEAVLNGVKAVGKKKSETDSRNIRGLGTWRVYREDAHRLGSFLLRGRFADLRDIGRLRRFVRAYLVMRRRTLRLSGGSYQTYERETQALGKLSDAMLVYADRHKLALGDGFKDILVAEKSLAKETLLARSSTYGNRAYPDPDGLIAAMANPVHQLQARLQAESGCRAEGVGAPSRGSNPLTQANLRGIVTDPVNGLTAGSIEVVEKGGKRTTHFVTTRTYAELNAHLKAHGKLESSYRSYVRAIETAARLTGQFVSGRGTHGLKHSFAQRRFSEAVAQGFMYEEAKQATALELAHNRLDATDIYLR